MLQFILETDARGGEAFERLAEQMLGSGKPWTPQPASPHLLRRCTRRLFLSWDLLSQQLEILPPPARLPPRLQEGAQGRSLWGAGAGEPPHADPAPRRAWCDREPPSNPNPCLFQGKQIVTVIAFHRKFLLPVEDFISP